MSYLHRMSNAALPVAQSSSSNVPHAVRVIMAIRGKKSADLATVLHLNEGSVSKRLSGKIQFRADELEAMAAWLDVEPGDFFLSPTELLRSRCFASLPAVPGQMTLALGVERPRLAAV